MQTLSLGFLADTASSTPQLSNRQILAKQTISKVDLQHFQRNSAKVALKSENTQIQIKTSGPNAIILAVAIRTIQFHLLNDSLENLMEDLVDPEHADFRLLTLESLAEKEYYNFCHQQTLRQLVRAALNRMKLLKDRHALTTKRHISYIVCSVINLHPILEYALVAYVRTRALSYLQKNIYTYMYDILGNEEAILRNPNSDLRNLPLKVIVECFQIGISVQYSTCFEEVTPSVNTLTSVNLKKINSNTVLLETLGCEESLKDVEKFQIAVKVHGKSGVDRKSNGSTASKAWGRQSLESNTGVEGRICLKCGKLKIEKYCSCRKQIGVSSKGQNLVKSAFDVFGLAFPANTFKKCQNCNMNKALFKGDIYCGQCIWKLNMQRCGRCNSLYEVVCEKCEEGHLKK